MKKKPKFTQNRSWYIDMTVYVVIYHLLKWYMAISDAYKIHFEYCRRFTWAQKAVVRVNQAQPRGLDHRIRHRAKHIIAVSRLRIEYLFQSGFPAKIEELVTAYFFLFIVLAKRTPSLIEEIKCQRQYSALTDLHIQVIQKPYSKGPTLHGTTDPRVHCSLNQGVQECLLS